MTHRIVAVTPAGRRRYMRLLVPYILSSPCIDRYDIWVNTVEPNDLAFLEALEQHDKINLIPQPDGIVKGTRCNVDFGPDDISLIINSYFIDLNIN